MAKDRTNQGGPTSSPKDEPTSDRDHRKAQSRDELQDEFPGAEVLALSPALRDKYRPEESFVLTMKDWGAASDHRPVCVRLEF